MSNLLVQNIKHTNGTTAQTIDSSGRVFRSNIPNWLVRGHAGSASLTAANANFDYITSYTTTDANVGNCIQSGILVPPVDGLYSVSYFSNENTSNNYNSSVMYVYDGSSYTQIFWHYGADDYANYTLGATVTLSLTTSHRVYVGFDDRYSAAVSDNGKSSFSGFLIG